MDSELGVRVGGVACFQLESVFKTARVGVGSRFFKTAGVGVGFSKLLESEHLLQLPTPMFIK